MSEWIKCVDSLPRQGQRVIVHSCEVVTIGEYWFYEPGIHDSDTSFCDLNQDEIFCVTHWQPLPPPPGAPE